MDDELLAWLTEMFERRGAPMPDANRKQAWLVEESTALHNAHGSAPGWWVERDDGGLIIALPGPPREMWPMWRDEALPRLKEHGLGVDRAARTLRLTGIGESALVGLIGEDVLRAANPIVATYARPDAVDVVVSAESAAGMAAAQMADDAIRVLRARIGHYVFAEGDESWADALAKVIGERTLSMVELGTAGVVTALLGEGPFVRFAELLGDGQDLAMAETNLGHYAESVRELWPRRHRLGRVRPASTRHPRESCHQYEHTDDRAAANGVPGRPEGRRRAALAAAAVLWETLREGPLP